MEPTKYQYEKAAVLAAEVEEGNREYKYKLTDLTEEQLNHRITQLNWRLNEGNDEAIYQIGVEDDGNPLGISEEDLEASLVNLRIMADTVGCSMSVKKIFEGKSGLTAEVWLRRLERQILQPNQVHVALAGDFDAGKSTLIGVLSTGKLDNGRGLARMQVLTHNHEVCSGLTSSVSQRNLYFSVDGKVLQSEVEGRSRLRSRSELELADITSRIVSFIDLCGHRKYLKTTLHALVSHQLDRCLLCISAKKGVQTMTSEHLGVACALRLPLAVAITKVDTVEAAPVQALVASLKKFLGSGKRDVVLIQNQEQLIEMFCLHQEPAKETKLNIHRSLVDESLELPCKLGLRGEQQAGSKEHKASLGDPIDHSKEIIPIFLVSSVTGQGLDLLRFYLFHSPTRDREVMTSMKTAGDVSVEPARHDAAADGAIATGVVGEAPASIRAIGGAAEHQPGPVLRVLGSYTSKRLAPSLESHAHRSTVAHVRGDDHCGDNAVGLDLDSDFVLHSSLTPDRNRLSCHPPSVQSSPEAEKERVIAAVVDSAAGSSPFPPKSFEYTDTIFLCAIQTGFVSVGDQLLLGPVVTSSRNSATSTPGSTSMASLLPEYGYHRVLVKSLRVNDVPVRRAMEEQYVTLVLTQVEHKRQVDLAGTSTDPSLVGEADSRPLTRREDFADTSGVESQILASDTASVNTRLSDKASGDLGDRAGTSSVISVGVVKSSSEAAAAAVSGSPVVVAASASRRRPTAGLVLLSPDAVQQPQIHWEFECSLLVLNHPSKIKLNYEPVIHIGSIKQSGRLVAIRPEHLPVGSEIVAEKAPAASTAAAVATDEAPAGDWTSSAAAEEAGLSNGDRAICRFRFLYHPEFIVVGSDVLIREGSTRGVGRVSKTDFAPIWL